MLETLEARAAELEAAQFDGGLAFPVGLEDGACALIEAWAAGEEWAALLSNTSLDAGDVYRILRRTMELLRSVSAVPYVAAGVKAAAAGALRAMNRYPLADNALMGLGQADDADADAAAPAEPDRAA